MVEVDVGFAIFAILASLFGSLIQFWISTIKEELKGTNKLLDDLKEQMKETLPKLKTVKNRRKFLRSYVKKKRKEIRQSYLDKWLIAVFFGIVAGILYLLVGPIVPDTGYFITAVFNGYAGESYVTGILKEENLFEDWNKEDIIAFAENFAD